MNIQAITGGATALLLIPGGFWALGKFGPGFVAGKMHDGFQKLKASTWVRDPAKPKRARALVAVAELLEDEIPAPGTGQEVYDAFGAEIAAHVSVGSAAQWSKVARQVGDAIQLELDADVKDLGAQTPPPAAG